MTWMKFKKILKKVVTNKKFSTYTFFYGILFSVIYSSHIGILLGILIGFVTPSVVMFLCEAFMIPILEKKFGWGLYDEDLEDIEDDE